MTIRHLDQLLTPRSVAVFGASDRPGSVGATVWRNVRQAPFTGPRWPVNPRRERLGDDVCFPDVAALPQAPDLAVICTPPASVPGLIEALGARGTRAAVVLTAGLDAATKAAMLNAAGRHLLRILGPNCLGLLAPHIGLNASFAHVDARPGALAFVSQSGALVTAMLDWAAGRGIGFSHCISLGEHADVDFGDLLDWLAGCPHTRAILLYAESVEGARKFMSAARAAARNKPVLIVKAGRSAQGQAAAASHTGALAASDLVLDAAIRRAGMLRVDTLQDLFDAAETLSHFKGPIVSDAALLAPAADALMLVTNGGGAGVLAADACAREGVALAPLTPALQAALEPGLPPNWSRANPVDIIGDAPVERYVHTLRTLLQAPGSGTVLFMHAPTAIVPSADIARALVAELGPLLRAAPGRLQACWLGAQAVQQAREIFDAAGIACHDTPENAVRAFSMLATYRRNQFELMQTPPLQPALAQAPATPDAVIDQALAEGREMLTEPEAKALLAAAGVPVVATTLAGPTPQAAVQAARTLGFPVVLKVLSAQISHKSDVGGVALNLESEQEVAAAAQAMLARVAQRRPDALIEGFTVQPMVRRPRALELIIGSSIDPQFGPVLLFGQGGTAVEVLADRAVALPPLNAALARALIERTRVARLLHGWRDVPPADIDAVVGTLLAVSQLLASEPRIAEIDINPLLCDAQGALALDARVRVSATGPGGAQRFAIRPYPQELVETVTWQGRPLVLRPIRPEDEPQHAAFVERLDPLDMRLRFFYSRRSIGHTEMARLTQIDYEREMAFIATVADTAGREETLGVARAVADPDNEQAEFAIVVRSDLKGGGLGELLMRKLITHFRNRGTRRMVGDVLKENERMLELARHLGFEVDPAHDDPDTTRVRLSLQQA
ncbi:MAG: bifunctional acetate--CoA ligase family protein/GNAT family N-acetyltransferase [Rubrivivax sp.]|jgi:acetyltransferase|nr:bifunctional acetate--CoA ligase family protein/GNAT family N-acetyltransferase [Rubrivivax sp.]